MITPEYCRVMARYNRWQNEQLTRSFEGISDDELRKDRGAFFGSLFATANHLLWGDLLWLSRFDGGPGPKVSDLSKTDTTDATQNLAEWSTERFRLDGRFTAWAKQVTHTALSGNMTWYSGSIGREVSKPRMICVVQMFNHQTHHRGQIHAMLGAAGAEMPVTDIPFMPD